MLSLSLLLVFPLPFLRLCYVGAVGLLILLWCGFRVFLHATDESALQNGITMDALKKFAAEGEAQGGGGRLEKNEPVSPETPGGIARETH